MLEPAGCCQVCRRVRRQQVTTEVEGTWNRSHYWVKFILLGTHILAHRLARRRFEDVVVGWSLTIFKVVWWGSLGFIEQFLSAGWFLYDVSPPTRLIQVRDMEHLFWPRLAFWSLLHASRFLDTSRKFFFDMFKQLLLLVLFDSGQVFS